jgi:hypothetical protein
LEDDDVVVLEGLGAEFVGAGAVAGDVESEIVGEEVVELFESSQLED